MIKCKEILAIIGPRQSGKSLLAVALAKEFETLPGNNKKVAIIRDAYNAGYNKKCGNTRYPKMNEEYDIVIYDGCQPPGDCRFIYTTSHAGNVNQYFWNERIKGENHPIVRSDEND